MCFGNNPGCSCCKQLPLWTGGARSSLNSDIVSSGGPAGGLITVSPLDADDFYQTRTRSYDVVYGGSTTTISQSNAKTFDLIWTSDAVDSFAGSVWRHASVGDFGLVLMESHHTTTTSEDYSNVPLALEIDKAGTWVIEPRSVTELVVDGSVLDPTAMGQFLLTFSQNSKHAIVEWVDGTYEMVAGAYEFEIIDADECRLIVVNEYSHSTSATSFSRTARLGIDRNDNLYLVTSKGRIVLPGLNVSSTSYAAILNCTPGPDFSWVWANATSTPKVIHHGVRSREGGGYEVTTADDWTTITPWAVGASTYVSLLRARIVGAYACNCLLTPADAAILFPALNTDGVELNGSGQIDFRRYYLNASHTQMRIREPYNFGEVFALDMDSNSDPREPGHQVIDQDSVSAHTGVEFFVGIEETGTELLADEAWSLDETDAVFYLVFSAGPLSEFTIADIQVYLMRFNGTAIGQGPDPTITHDALESADLVATDATHYTLTVPNVSGGANGGAMTITMKGTSIAYLTANGLPVAKVPTADLPDPAVKWYIVAPA